MFNQKSKAHMESTTVKKEKEVSPSQILEVGLGFWTSKTLLTAIKLELFTYLGESQVHAEEIRTGLGLDARSHFDFLDALVALGFLKREGIGSSAFYENTLETSRYLDKKKPSYIGG